MAWYSAELIKRTLFPDGRIEVIVRLDVRGVIREVGHIYPSRDALAAELQALPERLADSNVLPLLLLAHRLPRDPQLGNAALAGAKLDVTPDGVTPVTGV